MPTSRIKNLDATKLRSIMVAAVKEFSQFEYSKSSYNRIIRNSGISKGALYYYFESKEDLFLVIMKNCIRGLQKAMVPSEDIRSADHYWQEVDRLLLLLFDYIEDDPALGRFLRQVLTNPARAEGSPAETVLKGLNEWLYSFMRIGIRQGAVRGDLAIELMTSVAWGIWQSVAAWQAQGGATGRGDQAEHSAAMMTDFLKRNLQQDPANCAT